MISDSEFAVRILLAATFAALLGIEREIRDQPAGLRTHMLVGLGACLFTLASAYGFNGLAGSGTTGVRADVTRVASQVVVGIGFLGGGTILRHGITVRGLTTAASLWVTAAVGLAVAIGMYFAAGITTLVAFLSLTVLKPLERWMARRFATAEPPPPEPPTD